VCWAAPVLCACGQQGLVLDKALVESCARGARCMPLCRRRRMPLFVFTTPVSTPHPTTRWSVILFALTHPDPHPRATPPPRSNRKADICVSSPATHRLIFIYPQCGTDLSLELATFGEAGWSAARPSEGQDRVSTPSVRAPPSCGRPPVALEGRLLGWAALGHSLGRLWTGGPGFNLSRPPLGRPAGWRPAPLLGRAASPRRLRGRPFRAGARRRRERSASLVRRPQDNALVASVDRRLRCKSESATFGGGRMDRGTLLRTVCSIDVETLRPQPCKKSSRRVIKPLAETVRPLPVCQNTIVRRAPTATTSQ